MALLEIQHLSKRFIEHSSLFHKHDFYAVKNVSFTLNRRETLAIIGENGSGKSTLAKMIIGQVEPTSGQMPNISEWYSKIQMMLLILTIISGRF